MMRQGKLHGKIAGHSEMNGNITNETLSICKEPFKYGFFPEILVFVQETFFISCHHGNSGMERFLPTKPR